VPDGGPGGPCVEDNQMACAGKCGDLLNNCNKPVHCGNCPVGQNCGGGGPNMCGTAACTPDCTGKPCGASAGCQHLCDMGSCPSGQRCIDSVCGCDSMSCANGCCTQNQCVAGDTDSLCGSGGAMCTACGSAQICDSQACASCGAPNQPCCPTTPSC